MFRANKRVMVIPTRKLISLSPELSDKFTLNYEFLRSIEWHIRDIGLRGTLHRCLLNCPRSRQKSIMFWYLFDVEKIQDFVIWRASIGKIVRGYFRNYGRLLAIT